MTSRAWLVSVSAASALLAACEVPRPEGAYTPDAGTSQSTAPSTATASDASGIPNLGTQDMPALGADGAVSAMPGTPLEALQKRLTGDYWMRVDLYAASTGSSVEIETQTTTFSLVRVGADPEDGAFKMEDWQCRESFAQTCKQGCSSAETSVGAEGGHAYKPAVRELTIDPDTQTWSAAMVPFALGFQGDYREEPNTTLPTSADDPRVLRDADGPGVNVTVDVAGFSCQNQVVQKISLAYSGQLVDGSFERGTVMESGSDQMVLKGNCPSGTSSPSRPYTLRLVPAPKPIGDWQCPTEAEFRAPLANP